MGKDGAGRIGRGGGGETGYVNARKRGQISFIDSIKAFTGEQAYYPADALPALSSLSTLPQAIRAPPPPKSAPSGSSQERGDRETDTEPSDEASIHGQTTEGYQTTSTPSSDDEVWQPTAPFGRGRLRKRRSSPEPIAAAAESPSRFISLLSSSSSGVSTPSSDSDSDVVVVRSHKCKAEALKRKFQDALEPEGRRIRPRLRENDKSGEREWNQRDRGVLAEALQDGLDFRKVGEMLGREGDDGTVILYAPPGPGFF